MSHSEQMTGTCLCGAVSISVAASESVEACHCGMCRRWSSGPYLALHVGTDIQITGTDQVSRFRSSAEGERGFCKICGSHLFYYFVASKRYALSAGLFQNQADFLLTAQIYVDNKPDYYSFAENTHMMTEAEVIQQFADQ